MVRPVEHGALNIHHGVSREEALPHGLAHALVHGGDEVKSAKAGDIVVVPKLNDVRAGDTLSCEGTIAIEPLPLPEPLYPVAIEAGLVDAHRHVVGHAEAAVALRVREIGADVPS